MQGEEMPGLHKREGLHCRQCACPHSLVGGETGILAFCIAHASYGGRRDGEKSRQEKRLMRSGEIHHGSPCRLCGTHIDFEVDFTFGGGHQRRRVERFLKEIEGLHRNFKKLRCSFLVAKRSYIFIQRFFVNQRRHDPFL